MHRSFLLFALAACMFTAGVFELLSGDAYSQSRNAGTSNYTYFGRVTVKPDFVLDGQGENIDSIAFWEDPDSSKTLMFVTAKANALVEVWAYPFRDQELTPITANFSGDSKVNGIAIDQGSARLYVVESKPASTVSVFSLPERQFLFEMISADLDLRSEPNLTLLNHANGETWLYVTADKPVHVYETGEHKLVSTFTPADSGGPEEIETAVADEFHQMLYVPDENGRRGVFVYTPDGTVYTENGANPFGGADIFDSDAEGILLYRCPCNGLADDGSGFIIVADQKSGLTDFEFFDRITWAHLGSLNIEGVSNTDGIASTQRALPDYPAGLFAAVNNDKTVVGVGWDNILRAMGLHCRNGDDLSTVVGRVIEAFIKTPLAEVQVALQSDDFTAQTVSNANGWFRFADVMPGTFTLTLAKQNYVDQVDAFTIAAGEDFCGKTYELASTIPVPVEFTLFKAEVKEDDVILQWCVEDVVNNAGFAIERKSGPQPFQEIAFVRANGTFANQDYTYRDAAVEPGQYDYRLKQIDTNGDFSYSKAIQVNIESPQAFRLFHNYPNPFNGRTTIVYTLPQPSEVTLEIFNSQGQPVQKITHGQQGPGRHKAVWHGDQFDGQPAASGVYLCRISAGDWQHKVKIVLMR